MRGTTTRGVLILILAGLGASLALTQTQRKPVPSEKPELRLSIILDKEAYSLREKVFAKTKFTNVSERTLCFPIPPQDEVVAVNGVLDTTLTLPDGSEDTQFLKIFDGAGLRSREELLQEIKERWIWLRPTESYVTKSAQIQIALSVPGRWRINTSYRPPEGSFRSAEYRKWLSSAAASAGCKLPHVEVTADPVTFSVYE